MPKIDPVQPRMQDHSELYLRLSVPAVRDLRNTLMTSLAMSPSMRSRSNEKLFLLGMVDRQGELTNMGAFPAELGQPECRVACGMPESSKLWKTLTCLPSWKEVNLSQRETC